MSRSVVSIIGLLAACASSPLRTASAPAQPDAHEAHNTLESPLAPASTAPALAPHLAQLRLAVVEYRHAIGLDPDRPEAWFNLGALLLDARLRRTS
jgi:hypothetical protein